MLYNLQYSILHPRLLARTNASAVANDLTLPREGLSNRQIAKALGVSPMTVGRDVGATNVAPSATNVAPKDDRDVGATNVAPTAPNGAPKSSPEPWPPP
jgi:hypothetical protein